MYLHALYTVIVLRTPQTNLRLDVSYLYLNYYVWPRLFVSSLAIWSRSIIRQQVLPSALIQFTAQSHSKCIRTSGNALLM